MALGLFYATGNVSTYTYTVKIWDLSSNNLNAVIANGTSGGVSGSVLTDATTMVYFSFATPPTLAANTKYCITVESNTINASNYAKHNFVDGTTSSIITHLLSANSTGTTVERTDKESTIGIYYYD